MKLDPKQVKAWKKGWEEVAEFEAEERRHMTPREKLVQIVQALQLSQALGASLERSEREEKEIKKVRRRWVHLKKWMEKEKAKRDRSRS